MMRELKPWQSNTISTHKGTRCILLVLALCSEHALASQGIVAEELSMNRTQPFHPSLTGINVTKLDCGMRQLALDYAKTLAVNDIDTWRNVHEALRLEDLCHIPFSSDPIFPTPPSPQNAAFTDLSSLDELCSKPNHCLHVITTARNNPDEELCSKESNANLRHKSKWDGSLGCPFLSIHDAIQESRTLRQELLQNHPSLSMPRISIVMGPGIHSLNGKTVQLSSQDDGLTIVGIPGEEVWLSGGIPIQNVTFEPLQESPGIYVGNLSTLLENHPLPPLVSLFTTSHRWIRARYPNANPETDQWGYASRNRLKYSMPSQWVLEWHLPPQGQVPNFTLVDFQDSSPDGVPLKNDSMQRGYNWYASGKGGVCSDVWGSQADSYWCSNASQGGWAEVDQECATTGKMQLPIGLTYNTTTDLRRFDKSPLQGAILHAWHSQSWAMHMFEIIHHYPQTGVIELARGGGKQGGRNWCRCDQCTYAAGWCGQHQTPPWHDTRLISGTWMIENVKEELDQSGEYFFDRKTKLLYVMPNSTLDLIDFRVGLLERIFEFHGSSNVTVANVGFRDTAPTYHPDFDWSAPSGGDWSLHRGGAIFLENVINISIRNCTFRRLDGNAIFLSRRTRNVTIEGNRFEWLGENAIATWGDTADYDGTGEEFPMFTAIRGNVMRELGIYEKQSSAVGQAKAAHTYISHNIMFNMPRAAINFNDMLGGGDLVTQNLIFNTCRESGDHGPINTWDRQPFLTTLRDGQTKSFGPIPREIEHNFIIANYGASQGVDNDDGSSWYHIHHNLFYSAEGFKMDYGGHDSIFEDNLIMSYPYDGGQCFNMGSFYKGHGDILRRNRCLVGLGNKMGSGCGDPSCADPIPESLESQQIVGHIWDRCDDSAVELSMNQYFTPDGEVQIGCGDDILSLEHIQQTFGMEIGSTRAKLPDEETMILWAKDVLTHGAKVLLRSESLMSLSVNSENI